MAIEFTCNACGKNIRVKDELAGRAGKCPGCGGRIKVPDDDVYDAQPYDDDYGDDYAEDDFDNPYASPAPARKKGGKRKPCPACGEMIVKTAAVCRFCGETFDGRARSKSRSRGGGGGGGGVDDDMTTGDWVVAIICSGIGCIAGIVWMIQGKPKGPKMLGVSILAAIVWNVIRFGLAAVAGGGGGNF